MEKKSGPKEQKLNEKECRLLEIYESKFFPDTHCWRILKAYDCDGKSDAELEEMDKKHVKKYREGKPRGRKTRLRQIQRTRENFRERTVFLKGKEDKEYIIHAILDNYPDPSFFKEKKVQGRLNWKAERLQKRGARGVYLLLENQVIRVKNINYSIETFQKGIDSYIEKQKRKLPTDKKIRKYYIDIIPVKEKKVHVAPTRKEKWSSVKNIGFGKYKVTRKSWSGKELKGAELIAPKYRASFAYYRKKEKVSDWSKLYMIYPFTSLINAEESADRDYFERNWRNFRNNAFGRGKIYGQWTSEEKLKLEKEEERKEEKAKKEQEQKEKREQERKANRKNRKQEAEEKEKEKEEKQKQKAEEEAKEPRLYIYLAKDIIGILPDTVRNAKIVKEWKKHTHEPFFY